MACTYPKCKGYPWSEVHIKCMLCDKPCCALYGEDAINNVCAEQGQMPHSFHVNEDGSLDSHFHDLCAEPCDIEKLKWICFRCLSDTLKEKITVKTKKREREVEASEEEEEEEKKKKETQEE